MARFSSTQTFISGNQNIAVDRNERLIAASLFWTLLVGAIVGGLALLVWSYQTGAAIGGRSVPPATINTPAPVSPTGGGVTGHPAPPIPPPTPTSIIIRAEPIRVAVEVKLPPPVPPPIKSGLPPNAW